MTHTVSALFDSYTDAERAVQDLETAGVPHSDISIVANNAHGRHAGTTGTDGAAGRRAAEDAGSGAEVGATIGGVGGLLAGLGLLAIPGLGPVVAAGWLAATAVGALGGAVVGAAAGGLVGALTKAGVPEDDAQTYAEGVRRGGALVTAKVTDASAPTARRILSGDHTVDLAARQSAYRQEGWTGFDATAPAYSAEQVAAEQARYRRL